MNFIYLLHFTEPLSHANHYVGATTNLRNRLEAHASGSGAKILARCLELGIGWRLANLWTTEHKTLAFHIEAWVKKNKNGPRHCKFCANKPLVWNNLDKYPIDQLPASFQTKVNIDV